ncbi:MAG: hypothetical protein GWP69_08440 [Gammaproteobacteria bacterium]|nr:hypothetical protein [Gammaproteobacteria bacterium]
MTDADPGYDETLAGQRLRLASLASFEDHIRVLRDQECDLEVEHIAARAALNSATDRLRPKVDPALASRIGRILEHRREREELRRQADEHQGSRGTGSAREVDRMRAGRAALQAWLDASRPRKPGGVVRAAKVIMLVATIVTVWAAFAVHLAFLLLLVVVVGPVSFAMGRGQDADWRRVGARRRFEGSGLAPMGTWDDESVRARMVELESLLANARPARRDEDVDSSHGNPLAAENADREIAEEDRQIMSDLSAAGLTMEDTKGDTGNWMRLVAREERSRRSLERVKDERKRLRTEANEHRDQLLRYLQSQGVKLIEQQDTAAAIAERLDRLSESP